MSKRRQRSVPSIFTPLGWTDNPGSSMALNLCSVLMLPSMTRCWSFVSQALGLMVDLDIGTENLKWMGDTRFVLGFLKGIVSSTNSRARIRINMVEDDKASMARIARERSHVVPATMGVGLDPLNPGKKAHGEAKSKSTQLTNDDGNGDGKATDKGHRDGHGRRMGPQRPRRPARTRATSLIPIPMMDLYQTQNHSNRRFLDHHRKWWKEPQNREKA